MCIILWLLAYSQSRTAITTINFRSVSSHPLFPPNYPRLGNHWSAFCLYRFTCSGHCTHMESYSMCSFVSGFFH